MIKKQQTGNPQDLGNIFTRKPQKHKDCERKICLLGISHSAEKALGEQLWLQNAVVSAEKRNVVYVWKKG